MEHCLRRGVRVVSGRMQPQHWVDAALLLTLWTRSARRPREDAGDRLRLMKLAFLAAYDLNEQRFRALDLTFYRWTWGPRSDEVCDVWETLVASGLMDEEERFLVTGDGEELADTFQREVLCDEPNERVRRTIDRIAQTWAGRMATKPILDHVNRLRVPPGAAGDGLYSSDRRVTVKATPRGRPLIEPLTELDASGSLTVSNAWIETLGMYCSATNEAGLLRAEQDFRERRFTASRSA